jgi:hypothetical protein
MRQTAEQWGEPALIKPYNATWRSLSAAAAVVVVAAVTAIYLTF